MSSTVSLGSMTVTSTHESGAEVAAALKPPAEDSAEPKILVDKGQPVDEEPKEGLSKAASDLGKEGAKARAKALKAKPIKDRKADEDQPSRSARDGGEAEADTGADAVGESEPEEKPSEAKEEAERKSRAQQRVEEATRAAAEAKREAAELRQRLDRIERERAPVQARDGQETKAQAAEDAEPEEGDFDSYSEWVKEHNKWAARDALRGYQREQQAHQAASQFASRLNGTIQGFKESMAKAEKADPEFRSKLSQDVMALEPSFTLAEGAPRGAKNAIADYLFARPGNAPAMAQYLSENPEEFQRIATLRARFDVTCEMAKIEARLDDATSGNPPSTRPASKPVSQAKPPIPPVTGSPHTADRDPDEDAPLSAFVKRHGQRELAASKR